MKYRAKVTHIPGHTTDLYYLKNVRFVTDEINIYIEVESDQEAELIEELDDLYVKLLLKRKEIFDFRKENFQTFSSK